MEHIRRDDATVRFSRRLAMILMAVVTVLVLVTGMTTVWIAREHNRLSEADTTRMIAGGISALEDKLEMITLDYSLWAPAYRAIRAGDAPWIYENIGTSAASEVAAVDLIIVVEPGEAVQFGWVGGMGAEPSADLLPADTIAAMLRLLDDIAVESRQVASRFARIDGQTWLLAITRVLPYDGLPDGITDKDLPRHLFGLKIDDALMSDLGAHFLVDDLKLAPEPEPGMSNLPLGDSSGFGGYAVWTPNRPGNVILENIAIPLILALATIALVSALVVRSAVRLERAVDAAEAADRFKTEFVANISHELRTPMNGILGMGQLIQKMELEPKVATMMGVLMASARSQMVLIEGLLDIARIESGNRRLDRSPFDPVAALNEVCDMMALKADAKGIAFNVEAPADLNTHVLGDKGCYKQILTNLIANAIKFTDHGQVSVRMRPAVRHDQMHIALEVVDTGQGIDPKNHERIFERFEQVEGTLNRGIQGAGLGLAITRSLIDLMGGKLGLQSALGKGSTFSVDLAFEVAENPDASRAAV
ncbi:MAG: sensor histidine kinase [Alphaproteobacteria bacterium]